MTYKAYKRTEIASVLSVVLSTWCMLCAKSLGSCPILRCGGLYSPPGSSDRGIMQARILKWVPMLYTFKS